MSAPSVLPALSQRVRTMLSIDPSAPAIAFEGTTFPWQYYTDAWQGLEAALTDAGAESARTIGVVLRNQPPHLAALIATVAGGRTIVTLSPFHGDEGLAEDIRTMRPRVIVASAADWARPVVFEAAEEIGAVRIVAGDEGPLRRAPDQAGTKVADQPPEEDDGNVVLMLTSGTTGRPKRVPLAYDRLTAAYDAAGHGAELDVAPQLKKGAAILWTSMVHIGGMYYAIGNVVEGREIALLEKFDVQKWAQAVVDHRPRLPSLNPTAMQMVLDSDVPDDLLSSALAVMSGTAPLPPARQAAFEARFGVPVLTTYGATEFAGAVAGWSLKDRKEWGDRKPGSAGRVFRGVEMRVLDQETGEPLPLGEVGLLQVRGGQLPNGGADGWVATNDLASLDADNFLYIHGRADDAINRGGFKIPPVVITDVLEAHPAVDKAAAVGLPDRRLGAVPVAVVTLKEGAATPTGEELKQWCNEHLTRYQVPVSIKVVDEMPRTPSMKISQPGVKAFFDGDGIGDAG
ncbi:MAG: fatty acid--CoA ligase family protein [Ilumatobacteraceae bacterium]